MTKPNLLKPNFCVQNRQVFHLYRLYSQMFLMFGLYMKFGWYRISVYLGFDFDRFHCSLFWCCTPTKQVLTYFFLSLSFVLCLHVYINNNNILITLEIGKGNIWIEMNMKLNPSDIQVTVQGKGITLVKY